LSVRLCNVIFVLAPRAGRAGGEKAVRGHRTELKMKKKGRKQRERVMVGVSLQLVARDDD
jgi:hypothetical protein